MKKLLTSAIAVVSMLAAPSSVAPAGAADGTGYGFELPSIEPHEPPVAHPHHRFGLRRTHVDAG